MSEGHWRFRNEPAGTVIRLLGGARATARLLGVSGEAVSQWNRPAERGGTGGWVPDRFWETILIEAASRDLDEITPELLATGHQEKLDVAHRNKIKGDRFERQVVDDLKAAGFKAHRVPLSGAVEGYIGDVIVDDTPTGRWIIQCKYTADHTAGGRQSVARLLGQAVMGEVAAGKDARLVAMQKDVFIAFLNGRTPEVANMPTIKIPGKQIVDHLEGHDALLFRRNGDKAWMAIVRADRWD